MADAPTRGPGFSSSPWILLHPRLGFSVASRSMSAVISALAGGRPLPVRAGRRAVDQAAVPAQDGAGRDQPVPPQPCRHKPGERGEDRAAAQSSRGQGLARRSTATSCRGTSSSASLEADDRLSRTSQPQPDEDEIEQPQAHG
jgi:hypothetical protein